MTGWWTALCRRRPTEPGDLAGGVSRALAEEILGRLRQLNLIAASARRSAEVGSIREQLLHLVGLWRRLLQAHDVDATGRCPRCRTWRGSRRKWPCAVWRVAFDELVTHELPAHPGD